ncbi:hypothetical protein GCM10010123_16380 [Pilimelia anulata]|uniref:XRE family transcriptional regulator n=1 Tax=Pilimelia anulata TaxID=53371 RepID=A0A8J3B9L5_9ACTN|nr:hypothetical protein [Pilimelia anulata]GGJ87522.1 hypothetical protein GCM10010123_16380 [Pilimelia anulata]
MREQPRTLLAALIQQSDRTLEEWARVLAAADDGAAISARHLGRLARAERGGAGQHPATRRALTAVFGHSVDRLLSPWPPPIGPADGAGAAPPDGGGRSTLTMAAERARRFALLTADAGTAGAVLDQLHDDVHRLTLAYPQQPVGALLPDLTETQDTLFTLLERRQAPGPARRLHFLAAVVSGLLAKASHDLAEPHAAMLQARTAVLCADLADHDGLRAWLRGLQSLVAYWAGRYADAVRYAEAGAALADRAGGTAAVWLPVSAARAHAALGDAGRALAAIRRADDGWSRVRPDDVDALGGICTFTRARMLYYAADALAWLPAEAATAGRYAEAAVAAYADPRDPAWAFGDRAGSHTDLAIARIAGRDLDGAGDALRPVLDLPAAQRINGVRHSVRRVQRALVHAGLAGAGTGLVEEIDAFTAAPVPGVPG